MGKEKRQSPSTLLWFIRHKSYVPISELRRRFYTDDEEGCFIDAGHDRRVFVGLPRGTAQSIEKLWQQGKIGFEFSVEFDADVLIGVYPMNPSKDDLNGYGPHRRPVPPAIQSTVTQVEPEAHEQLIVPVDEAPREESIRLDESA